MNVLFLVLSGLAYGSDPKQSGPPPAPDPVKLSVMPSAGGHFMATHVTDFPVDAEGNRFGEDTLIHYRSRPGFTVGNSQVSFATQWDIFTGYTFDQTWDVPGTVDARRRHETGLLRLESFKPRRASVKAKLPGAEIEAGLVTSHWGLGMIANDGDHQPWFGRTDFGDRVVRLRATTAPGPKSPVSISAAYDQVVEDDLARWSDGQAASQVVGALVYRDGDERTLGLYAVVRDQHEILAQRSTHARVFDVFGSTPIDVGEARRFVVSAEVAGIDGRTNRATTYNSTESVKIRSAGATGLMTYGTADERYSAHLSAGWASGDGDPSDGVSNDFRFDRDFGVGQVLFDEYLGAIDAAAHHTLSDPQYAGLPPDGLDATVSEGAFQTASFVQPILEARVHRLVNLRAGGAVSWSTKPIAQRFYTHRAGGEPHNHHNAPTEGYHLGNELNWTLTIGQAEAGSSVLSLSGGHLMLGDALQGAGPDRIDLYRVVLGTN